MHDNPRNLNSSWPKGVSLRIYALLCIARSILRPCHTTRRITGNGRDFNHQRALAAASRTGSGVKFSTPGTYAVNLTGRFNGGTTA
jgi:hypothetical protein